jgi:hypothetical protein
MVTVMSRTELTTTATSARAWEKPEFSVVVGFYLALQR